jgi:AcrR family transcriptional regulator
MPPKVIATRRNIAGNVKDTALLERRRKEVVEAATAVFLRDGFHKASVRDIAEAAGVSQGSLYNYVRTKEDLLYLICESGVSAFKADVVQAMEGVTSPRERLECAVRAAVISSRNHRNQILVVYRDSHSLDAPSRKIIVKIANSFTHLLASVIEAAMKDGSAVRGDPTLAANSVIHLSTLFALRGWSLRSHSPDDVIDYLVGFIMAGLKENTASQSAAAFKLRTR